MVDGLWFGLRGFEYQGDKTLGRAAILGHLLEAMNFLRGSRVDDDTRVNDGHK